MILNTEAAVQKCSVKKVFLKISQNFFSYRTPPMDATLNKLHIFLS